MKDFSMINASESVLNICEHPHFWSEIYVTTSVFEMFTRVWRAFETIFHEWMNFVCEQGFTHILNWNNHKISFPYMFSKSIFLQWK